MNIGRPRYFGGIFAALVYGLSGCGQFVDDFENGRLEARIDGEWVFDSIEGESDDSDLLSAFSDLSIVLAEDHTYKISGQSYGTSRGTWRVQDGEVLLTLLEIDGRPANGSGALKAVGSELILRHDGLNFVFKR